jgi:hypothetical protein
LGIAAIEALDTDARIGGGSGYLLGLDSGTLVEHHADVAWFHIAFFVKFFAVDKFDACGQVLKGPVAAGGGDDDLVHFFFFARALEQDGQGIIGSRKGEGYFLVFITDEVDAYLLRAVRNVGKSNKAGGVGLSAFQYRRRAVLPEDGRAVQVGCGDPG